MLSQSLSILFVVSVFTPFQKNLFDFLDEAFLIIINWPIYPIRTKRVKKNFINPDLSNEITQEFF